MDTPLTELINIFTELGDHDAADIVRNKILEEKKLVVKSWNHGYDTRKNGLEWNPIAFIETLYKENTYENSTTETNGTP